jgi:putative hydrolase of the HAD superfamily
MSTPRPIPADVLVISLDLDDTLWPVAPVIEAAERALFDWLQQRYPRAVQDHSIDSLRRARTDIGERFAEHAHDFSFLRHRALIELLEAAGYAAAAADDAFEVFFAARNRVTAYDEVLVTLGRLRERYRLYALSNGNADLNRCGLGEFFAGHVSARTAGAAKPDAKIFAHLLQMAGADAHQVLHVGDDPVTDVAGAMAAGLHAAWINRDARPWPADLPAPDMIIASLDELAHGQPD